MTGKLQKETNQANLSSLFPRAHIESQENHSSCGHPRLRKVARPPSDRLNYTQKQRGAHTKRRNTPIPKREHDVQTVTKKSRKPDKPRKKRKEPSNYSLSDLLSNFQPVAHVPSSFISSQHIPLLQGHSPFMLRASCCDNSTRELLWHSEHSERGEPRDLGLTQHASLISWQRRSIAVWQLNATRPSSQSSKERETTSPDQFCPTTSRARLSTLRA